jgi:hypothetical protein
MKRQYPDQNELMIVNPGRLGSEEAFGLDQLFFGDDGSMYQLQELEEEQSPQGFDGLYLGEDGMLYKLENSEAMGTYETERRISPSHYFLGEDGTVYEIV